MHVRKNQEKLREEMGNAESSSETPRRKYDDDADDENIRPWLRRQEKKETDEGESSTQLSTVLKVGVAVVAGGLLALGALSLASSSSPSPSGESEAHVKSSYERQIKIMSYNVWFCGVEVEKRMEAIGNLVKKHSPDIILFQEVTPNIYKLFERSTWWQVYNPSVSSPDGRKPFCMLLSKLGVEMFIDKPFSNSNEKELCVGEINVGLYKKLIVATSHLKRPTTPQMTNSIERVSQAKEALQYLQHYPNVIFGGDMNWDEDEDGVFPLQGGWTDAWAELKREPGWTFDTKSNEMLKRHKPLQKRLDRFICKLEDFRMLKIEMIGNEAIPGLTYCNDKLPVFPSDHYGLILTISSNV